MDYEQAMQYIKDKNKLGSVPGTATILELLSRLDNPQDECKVVHIAGTNGKGSIFAELEAGLRFGGYRVGRYISPTIDTYLERFQINGEYISETQFARYLTMIAQKIDTMEAEGIASPTAFEIETAISFMYNKEQKVDIVLLEAGMGGRLDATNVVSHPLCTVIASISMDHMQFLGNTIPDITRHKVGIMRKGVPCIAYPGNPESLSVIQETAHTLNCQLVIPKVDKYTLKIVEETIYDSNFIYSGVDYKVSLAGQLQIMNAITAIEVANILQRKGFEHVNMKEGLLHTKWPGRFEVMAERPLIIRDGAHNYDAAKQLALTIQKHFTNKRIIYIIGVLEDKEYQKMLAETLPYGAVVIAVAPPNNIRALSVERLAEEAKKFCKEVYAEGDVAEALVLARQLANPEDVILAFGSLYYIGRIHG